jgi:hypothetical protein
MSGSDAQLRSLVYYLYRFRVFRRRWIRFQYLAFLCLTPETRNRFDLSWPMISDRAPPPARRPEPTGRRVGPTARREDQVFVNRIKEIANERR